MREEYAKAVERFAAETADAARRNLGRPQWRLSREIGYRTKFYASRDSRGRELGKTIGFVGVRGSLELERRYRRGVRSTEFNASTGEFRDKKIGKREYAEPIVYYRFHESGYFRRVSSDGRLFAGWRAVKRGNEFRAEKTFNGVVRNAGRINRKSGSYEATRAIRFFKRAAPTAKKFYDAIYRIDQDAFDAATAEIRRNR